MDFMPCRKDASAALRHTEITGAHLKSTEEEATQKDMTSESESHIGPEASQAAVNQEANQQADQQLQINPQRHADPRLRADQQRHANLRLETDLRIETEKWQKKAQELYARISGEDEFLQNISAYIKDCQYFLQKNDLIRAFEAIIWAWAWMEIGLEKGILRQIPS